MKINSITFQSLTNPDRMAMYSSVAPTIEEAYKVGIEQLIKEQGDLLWRPIMQTTMELEISTPVMYPLQTEELKPEINKENSNWILSTIITNKDTTLFDAVKKYLTQPEILFIEDKIK